MNTAREVAETLSHQPAYEIRRRVRHALSSTVRGKARGDKDVARRHSRGLP